MSIPNLNNIEFSDSINKYYNNFSQDKDQHNFIYNYMLPTMKIILSEIKDILVTTAESRFLEGLVFHPVSPTQDVYFNWNDFYHNISLTGLQDSSFFKEEIGIIKLNSSTGGVEIITIEDPLKMYYYNQYRTYANYLVK